MIAINLNNQISCETICNKIQQLVSDYHIKNPHHEDIILIVNIKEISYTTYPDRPKLEHKQLD